MNSFIRVLVKLASLSLAAGLIIACMVYLTGGMSSGRIEPGTIQPAATTQPRGPSRVTRTQVAARIEWVGSVQAEFRTSLSPRLTARITEMAVRSGDRVRKQQVLARLDDRDLNARLGQARQVLIAAEAARDLAQSETDKAEQLARQQVASQFELNQWRTRLAQAKADVLRAEQAIQEVSSMVADAVILSPIDGVVIERLAETGDLALPGRPLYSLYDPTRLRLEVAVGESYAGKLAVGQEAEVLIDATGRTTTGRISEIVPASDAASRSFLVRVALADVTGVHPGMYGRMRAAIGTSERLVIPMAAVSNVGQLDLVNVTDPKGTSRRLVRLGQKMGPLVEVLAGLSEGEIVQVP